MPRVGIVVPTLGTRPEYLPKCLASIRGAATNNKTYVVMVAPKNFDANEYLESGLVQALVEDPRKGLAEAINSGFSSMPGEIEYINWLGDDDLLAEGSLDIGVKHLDEDRSTIMVFGSCNYIDSEGAVVWKNKSGWLAIPLLRFGPNLIPQPGALFRKISFDSVGGLNPSLEWAFDFDLFIKLARIGKLRFMNRVLSSFRWHPDSLTVQERAMSVSEASKIRVSHLPLLLKPISCLWEYPVRNATMMAGKRVSEKSRRISQAK